MIKKMTAFFLALMICVISCIPTFAATSGSKGTQTFTVTTKSDWSKTGKESFTITQTKGTYRKGVFKKTNKESYGIYYITATPVSGKGVGKKPISKTLTGKSIKISLEKDTTYKVTVKFNDSGNPVKDFNNFKDFVKYPTWSVTATNKCTIK